MPNGRRESYEAVPRRPEQQGTEGPALSMALCSLFLCHPVSTIPYPRLKHTPSLHQPSVTPRTCSSVTLSPITSNLFTRLLVHLSTCHVTLSQPYPAPVSALCYSQNLFICYPVSYYKQLVYPSTRAPVNLPRYPVFLIPCLPIHLTLSPYPPYPVPTLSQKK
mgnify:CR=1 FL=1